MSLLNTYESDVSYFAEDLYIIHGTTDDYLPVVLNRKYSFIVGHQDSLPFKIKVFGASTYVMQRTYTVLNKGNIKWRTYTRVRELS